MRVLDPEPGRDGGLTSVLQQAVLPIPASPRTTSTPLCPS